MGAGPYWTRQVGEQEAGTGEGWVGGAVEGEEGAGTAGDPCLPADTYGFNIGDELIQVLVDCAFQCFRIY